MKMQQNHVKLWPGQGINYKLPFSVTLTSDIVMGLVRNTTTYHIIYIVNMFTKYHNDTTISCEVIAGTRYKLQNFDL